ncbi:MAG: hypothetical protein U0168_27015 [Nannocystaceae bacterium]
MGVALVALGTALLAGAAAVGVGIEARQPRRTLGEVTAEIAHARGDRDADLGAGQALLAGVAQLHEAAAADRDAGLAEVAGARDELALLCLEGEVDERLVVLDLVGLLAAERVDVRVGLAQALAVVLEPEQLGLGDALGQGGLDRVGALGRLGQAGLAVALAVGLAHQLREVGRDRVVLDRGAAALVLARGEAEPRHCHHPTDPCRTHVASLPSSARAPAWVPAAASECATGRGVSTITARPAPADRA